MINNHGVIIFFLKTILILFCILQLSFYSCKDKSKDDVLKKNEYEGYFANLEKIDEIRIKETEKILIGRILFFKYDHYNNNFIIGDLVFKDIKILDTLGNIINVLGKFGDGPGEFRRIARVAYDKNYYYIADDVIRRISKFSKDTGYVNSFNLPAEIAFDGNGMEIYNDNIFVSSWQMKYHPRDEVYKAKPITVLNSDGKILYHLGCYDEIYRKMRIYSTSPCFDIDENGFVYITNEQSWKVFKYDISGKLMSTFGTQGDKFLEQKESIRGNENYEEIVKLSLNTSTVQEFFVSDFVYFQYTNNSEKYIKTRSRSDQDHFLMVYTKDGEYIKSDIKLPGGGMKDVDKKGNIYIELSDEPDNRIIGKYKLKIVDEN